MQLAIRVVYLIGIDVRKCVPKMLYRLLTMVYHQKTIAQGNCIYHLNLRSAHFIATNRMRFVATK